MRRKALIGSLALLAVALFAVGSIGPPESAKAAGGVRIRQSWVYDWAWQGYYVLYNTSCQRGRTYVYEVVPETRVDDPDLYVGTRRPRGTNKPWCSPSNYLWKSTRNRGQTDKSVSPPATPGCTTSACTPTRRTGRAGTSASDR